MPNAPRTTLALLLATGGVLYGAITTGASEPGAAVAVALLVVGALAGLLAARDVDAALAHRIAWFPLYGLAMVFFFR